MKKMPGMKTRIILLHWATSILLSSCLMARVAAFSQSATLLLNSQSSGNFHRLKVHNAYFGGIVFGFCEWRTQTWKIFFIQCKTECNWYLIVPSLHILDSCVHDFFWKHFSLHLVNFCINRKRRRVKISRGKWDMPWANYLSHTNHPWHQNYHNYHKGHLSRCEMLHLSEWPSVAVKNQINVGKSFPFDWH